MLAEGCTPNLVTYNTLIDVYGKTGSWQEAVAVLDALEQQGIDPEIRTYNTGACVVVGGCTYNTGAGGAGVEGWRAVRAAAVAAHRPPPPPAPLAHLAAAAAHHACRHHFLLRRHRRRGGDQLPGACVRDP